MIWWLFFQLNCNLVPPLSNHIALQFQLRFQHWNISHQNLDHPINPEKRMIHLQFKFLLWLSTYKLNQDYQGKITKKFEWKYFWFIRQGPCQEFQTTSANKSDFKLSRVPGILWWKSLKNSQVPLYENSNFYGCQATVAPVLTRPLSKKFIKVKVLYR